MFKTHRMLPGLLTALVIGGASLTVAHATPITTQFDYTVSTVWVPPATFGGGDGAQTENATQISWGEDGGAEPWNGGDNRSGLEIEDVSPQPGQVFTNGGVAPTGVITHYNQIIDASFATLTEATLRTTLMLNAAVPDPAPNDPLALDQSLTFDIRFVETPNQGPCGFPHSTVCDDIFVIDLGSLDNSFDYLGNTYNVSIVTLSGNITPLPDATCDTASAAHGCLGFTTPEDANTPVSFGILVTADVPAPGVLSLMGLGLLGLGIARRRRTAA